MPTIPRRNPRFVSGEAGTKTLDMQSSGIPAPAWLWTWGGVSFGYREGDSLFTFDGVEAGRFYGGREVFGPDGRYLGETGTEAESCRLITNTYKSSRVQRAFVPTLGRSHRRQPDRQAIDLYAGHVDFPEPKTVKAHMPGLSKYAASRA